jgi:acetyltransferase
MPKDLNLFFNPKSIAIIGASRTPEKVGSIILRNIINSGFKGDIYPINPNTTEINGRKCYPDIFSIPDGCDLVAISLPSEISLDVISQVAQKGIKNIVLYASGFKEIGEEGKVLEEKLLKLISENELNLLGPNCLGFVNNNIGLNATFGESVKDVGNIKFISQSGAIAASIFDWANSIGLGFGEFITIGNKSDINENDILNYFKSISDREGDSSNFSIGMYLESISNGVEFIKIASELSKKHPIFIINPGKTSAATSAMKSHTGSIAGEDDVLDAALKQAGIIRCSSMEDFFDITKSFAWSQIPAGPNVAIISNAGGPAVISADAVVLEGLNLIEFNEATTSKLRKVLPRSASFHDPLDLMGDALAERYGHSAEIVIENSDVDYVLFLLTPQIMTQIEKTAEYISYVSSKYKKPIICSFIGGTNIAKGEEILNKNKIPVYRFPERAIKAIGSMWKYKKSIDLNSSSNHDNSFETISKIQEEDEVRKIIQHSINEKHITLENIEADKLMNYVGIKTPASRYILKIEEAREFVSQNNYPIVLKLSGQGMLHKLDAGGVITGIKSDQELQDAFNKIQLKTEMKNLQIQIQKQVENGIEIILGMKIDPVFGYLILFGAGGSFVEIIMDKNIHLLPMNHLQAKNLILNSKINKIIQKSEVNIDELVKVLIHFSKLEHIIPEAKEIEINPLIITKSDIWAVDSKVLMKDLVPTSLQAKGPKFITAQTTSNKNLSSKFHHSSFELSSPFEFIPGQYISVKVAPNTIRAYSIATRTDNKHFDLLVDSRPGGPGSQFFDNLKEGDSMDFLGPFGKFVFNPQDGSEEILFMATGSGMSATRCLIDCALKESKFTKKIKLYFGLTHDSEIFWAEHLEELKKQYPNFSYEISVADPSPEWQGNKGFITEIIKRDYPDAEKVSAYLCGHRNMISDVTDLLLANGCHPDRIYTERFS